MGAQSNRFAWSVLLLLLLVTPARAGVEMAARTLRVPGVTLQQVHVLVTPGPQGGLRIQLDAARADVPVMGWRRVGLHVDGVLQRDPHLRWILDGSAALQRAPGGALTDATVSLQVDEAANTLLLDLRQGTAQATTAVPLDQLSHAQIELKNLPFGWLQGLLSTVWSGQATGGRVDALVALDQRDEGIEASGRFGLRALGFDSTSGTLAAQNLDGAGRFTLDTTQGPSRISLDATLRDGELLLGPIYARLPDHAVQLSLDASARNGGLVFKHLHVGDPDAMQLTASMAFNARSDLTALAVSQLQMNLPAAYERYGSAWLGTFGLTDLTVAGELSATLDLRDDGLHAFTFRTDGMSFADGAGRIGVEALKGGLDWARDGTRPATELSWQGIRLYRLANGAAQSQWQSRDGLLALQQPVSMPLLDGRVRISELGWRPAAAKGQRLTASLAVSGVDMSAFSRAMGWPSFPGTLGGAISGLTVTGDEISLAGGLAINVFGGFVDLTGLTLQQPFGDNPVLSGDISLRQLDLGGITSVFDFGSITGTLDGSIKQLRLVNWQPVAFDARLRADEGGRISQRAVNNLTSVGGGGVAAGLQGAVLKLFKTFGYKRIGLDCRLQGSVCHMSGLEPTADGYTIVEGSGLPHLEVIGHESDVDWPTLIRRLKAAIAGNAPEVR
ncbi:hypothetical protein [Dyella sp.]|jgi:hypothetical protein|uniref:hypothetical protein n=1 Tax=Dyella sp. TaxID=1869338 RepID=UPI002D77A6EF|nr:hypothetical protein [Dyella sp.]HET6431484.1 hypothetical protein [Dyella sp.]